MKKNEVEISVTYEIVTPESAEIGEADESGYISEGEIYSLRDALSFLQREGIAQASSYPIFAHNDIRHDWLIGHPSEDYRTFTVETRSYHIKGDRRAKLALFRALGLVHES